jgi:hypothetical protein
MCLNRALEDTKVLAETEICVLKEPERRQRYEDMCPNIALQDKKGMCFLIEP